MTSAGPTGLGRTEASAPGVLARHELAASRQRLPKILRALVPSSSGDAAGSSPGWVPLEGPRSNGGQRQGGKCALRGNAVEYAQTGTDAGGQGGPPGDIPTQRSWAVEMWGGVFRAKGPVHAGGPAGELRGVFEEQPALLSERHMRRGKAVTSAESVTVRSAWNCPAAGNGRAAPLPQVPRGGTGGIWA